MQNFLKIDPRVSELEDPEIWHFPLTLLVVLTTLSHYRVRCDDGMKYTSRRLCESLYTSKAVLLFFRDNRSGELDVYLQDSVGEASRL